MRMVENEGINYIEHTYDVSDGMLDGLTVARRTNQDPDHVFKTLVTQGDDRNYYVFVIPVRIRTKINLQKGPLRFDKLFPVGIMEMSFLRGYG